MAEHYRSSTGGLKPAHPRQPRGTPGVAVLAVAPPVGRDVPCIAHRDAVELGGITESVHDLKGAGLLALDAERVHRVHDHDRSAFRQLPHDLEGNVEIATHLQDLRPVHERLGELAESDVSLGYQY